MLNFIKIFLPNFKKVKVKKDKLNKFESMKHAAEVSDQDDFKEDESQTGLSDEEKDAKLDRYQRKHFANLTYSFLKKWSITYWVFIYLYVAVFPLLLPWLAKKIEVELSGVVYTLWGVIHSVSVVTTVVIGVFGYIIKGLFIRGRKKIDTKKPNK